MTTDSDSMNCPRCKKDIPCSSNFCPKCGFKLLYQGSPINLSFPKLFILVILSLSLFAFGWSVKTSLAGKRPSKSFTEEASVGTEIDDPEIKKLRAEAEKTPMEIQGWRSLARVITEKLRSAEQPSSQLVFEAIDVLRKILDLDPKDKDALIAMADLSFDQQAFSKAAEFYERYIKLEPNDTNAHARYGSALTFVGKFDQALKELEAITKKDPKHFQAAAYVAITYAQMGKMDIAKEKARSALKLAPNEEARKRFSQFIDQLENADAQPKPENERGTLPKPEKALSEEAEKIAEVMKSSPVAGPKFAGASMEGEGTLILKFSNFPMQQMPPFAKDKFYSGIKAAAAQVEKRSIQVVRFVDASSGEELDTLKLK